ncbi:type II toxin-antitoxin system VapC family toxin [Sphingomonas sp. BK345]|uniref:type II toxin-antitoxin system VapC family toxin n=1 Tax=Sphingomonas sp. BK345 TaxID=2586980 RepID=UPI001612C5D0|nr:type II toxin-antitoxin system VapC family toxin [Sphingomonas sp. BK345]MBB3471949.1 putative nucleic-acid-binding protein [Sphingomonas sp. BK345]
MLETEWVLRGRRYAMRRNTTATLFEQIAETTTVTLEHEDGVRWAIGRYRLGADFADMIHLVVPAEATRFVTFDRRLARHAGTEAPLAIETLA